jgi:predicted secreted Zn-dependent protease
MKKFKTGETYSTETETSYDSAINYRATNATCSVTVAKRTAKTILTTCNRRLKIQEMNGAEYVAPYGSHWSYPLVFAN